MTLPTQMTVIEMREAGGPDVLVTGKRDVPQPRADEVLIKVTAAGVNGPDLVQRRGHYPPPKGASDLLGLEVSGEIVAIGAAQTQWAVGDHVCALTNGGGYAEYVAVTASHCLPIPAGRCLKWMQLAFPRLILPSGAMCSFSSKSNKMVFFLFMAVLAALARQRFSLARQWDCRFSRPLIRMSPAPIAKRLARNRAINFKQDDFVPILREAGGADIILDIIGGDYVARNIKAAHADARIIQLAFNLGSKMEIDLMPVMLKRLTLTGSTLRSRPEAFKSAVAADLQKTAWPFFDAAPAQLRATTFTSFDLADAAKAHELMESGTQRGKILLTI